MHTLPRPLEAVRLELLAETDAHEGPVYAADEDALYFTTARRGHPDDPRVDIRRLDLATRRVATVRPDANVANGMALERGGGLLVCEQGSFHEPARISLVDRRSGRAATVVDGWRGAPLSSPNDIVQAGDGAIWFTDPSYGHLQGFRPRPALRDAVYRHDPATGRTRRLAARFDKPNGLAFSPDERVLYVSDSGADEVVAVDPRTGWRLWAVHAPGGPDGLKVDQRGRIHVSSPGGVDVRDGRDGALLGTIALPGAVNFAFGADALFITTDTAVWAARGA